MQLTNSWKSLLRDDLRADYFMQLLKFLEEEKLKGEEIYPPEAEIFAALAYTPFEKVQVVILGQDPYHGYGQANGLSFSVAKGNRRPPSLLNIFKELHDDLGYPIPKNGNLEAWAKQGILLLNATLTVGAGRAGSHQKKGWETFTDAVIQKLNDERTGIIFLLWGRFAHEKAAMIDPSRHFILKAAHPSPLARTGFRGCRHFSKTNELLLLQGKQPINWDLS